MPRPCGRRRWGPKPERVPLLGHQRGQQPGWGEDGFYVCEIRVDGAKSNVRATAFVQNSSGTTIAATPAE